MPCFVQPMSTCPASRAAAVMGLIDGVHAIAERLWQSPMELGQSFFGPRQWLQEAVKLPRDIRQRLKHSGNNGGNLRNGCRRLRDRSIAAYCPVARLRGCRTELNGLELSHAVLWPLKQRHNKKSRTIWVDYF
jgi:hypothetical protein